MTYLEYLQSEHWQKTKERALTYYHYQCTFCGQKKFLNVHHKRYRDDSGVILFREKLSDLSVLCADCHSKHHDKVAECEIAMVEIVPDSDRAEQERERIKYYLENIGEYLQRQDQFINHLRKLRGAQPIIREVYNDK